MTETVKQKNTDRAEILIFLICFIFSALFLGLLWKIVPIYFETNDDYNIIEYVAGYRTGTPQPATRVSQYLFGLLLSLLYSAFPQIPWYICCSMFLCILSLSVLLFIFLRFTYTKPVHAAISVLVVIAMWIAFAEYNCLRLNFTVTGGFCGMAAICLPLSEFENDRSATRILHTVLLGILGFFAFNIRDKVGYLSIAIIVLTVGYKWLKKDIGIRKAAARILLLFLIFLGSFLSNYFFELSNGLHEYRMTFQKERRIFTDYEKLPYKENEEFYKSIGWDNELFELTSNWFFMDERVNYENLKVINSNRKETDMIKKIKTAISGIFKFGRLISVFCFFSCSIIWNAGWLICKIKRKDLSITVWTLLGKIGFMCGTIMLSLYFASEGRFPRRIASLLMLLMAVPTFLNLLLESNNCINKIKISEVKKSNVCEAKKIKKYILTDMLLFAVCLTILSAGEINAIKKIKDSSALIRIRMEINDYCLDHSSEFFIYDISVSGKIGDPFQVYLDKLPTNMMFWGGSGYNSLMYFKQLKINGYDTFESANFFDEQVRFISMESPNEKLLKYMEKKYPGCDWEEEYSNGVFVIYKFRREA